MFVCACVCANTIFHVRFWINQFGQFKKNWFPIDEETSWFDFGKDRYSLLFTFRTILNFFKKQGPLYGSKILYKNYMIILFLNYVCAYVKQTYILSNYISHLYSTKFRGHNLKNTSSIQASLHCIQCNHNQPAAHTKAQGCAKDIIWSDPRL